jgi:signal transduction histidine kinase
VTADGVGIDPSFIEGFDRLYGSSPVAVGLVELRSGVSEVVRANRALEQLFDVSPLAGRFLGDFTDAAEVLDDEPARDRLVSGRLDVVGRVKRYRRESGESFEVQLFATTIQRRPGRDLVLAVYTDALEWVRGYRNRTELVAVLGDIRTALLRADTDSALLELICRSVGDLLRIDHAGILALDEPDSLRLAAVDRGPEDPTIGRRYPVTGGEYDEVINARRTQQHAVPAGSLARFADHLPESVDVTRPMFVAVSPLLFSGRALGALAVRRASGPFEEVELELLEAYAREVGESIGLAELRADQERLRMLEVREEIGRNLHDEVTQDLIAVRLGLVHLARRVADAGVRAELERSLLDLDDATRRLRDVVAGLDQTTTADDFSDVLRSITGSKAERAQIDWGVTVHGPVGRLRDDERAELLRVVNEAVSNVVRHARAGRVDVYLTVFDAWVVLVVDDDGVGFAVTTGRQSGLANLQVRADHRRGGCTIIERPEGGTRLRWTIPLGDPVPAEVDGLDP